MPHVVKSDRWRKAGLLHGSLEARRERVGLEGTAIAGLADRLHEASSFATVLLGTSSNGPRHDDHDLVGSIRSLATIGAVILNEAYREDGSRPTPDEVIAGLTTYGLDSD